MKKGVNLHGDPSICMVVGCAAKALYRSSSKESAKSGRGYCSAHKGLAFTGQGWGGVAAGTSDAWIDRNADQFNSVNSTWAPECSDEV
jgi:hypothetical protein